MFQFITKVEYYFCFFSYLQLPVESQNQIMYYILKDLNNIFVERNQCNNYKYKAYRLYGWHFKTLNKWSYYKFITNIWLQHRIGLYWYLLIFKLHFYYFQCVNHVFYIIMVKEALRTFQMTMVFSLQLMNSGLSKSSGNQILFERSFRMAM